MVMVVVVVVGGVGGVGGVGVVVVVTGRIGGRQVGRVVVVEWLVGR